MFDVGNGSGVQSALIVSTGDFFHKKSQPISAT